MMNAGRNDNQKHDALMTPAELYDAAELDALGLLEVSELARFERSLASAPASIRREIRALQDRVAVNRSILPSAEPSAGLRQRVIESWKRAVHEGDTVRRHEAAQAGAGGLAGREMDSLEAATRGRRVSPLWRVAALGCATAALVFGATTLQLRGDFERLYSASKDESVLSEMIRAYGTAQMQAALFDQGTARVVFTAEAGFEGKVAVLASADRTTARLFALNLPGDEASTYRLAQVDEQGNLVRELAEFASTGALHTQDLTFAARSDTGSALRLALIVAPKGQPASAGRIVARATLA
ncbi:MAG: hypothetical protein SFY95_13190 [Planctomycetota bacterium]|nr:hypothetical protein [Planctomycetota bacterium]